MTDHRGQNHHNWKGSKVSYKSLHQWVSNNYGKSPICEECGENKKEIDWANVSGKYRRDRSDWKRLCRKCHYKLDWGIKGNPNAKLTEKQLDIIRNTPKKYGVAIKLARKFNVERHTIYRYLI